MKKCGFIAVIGAPNAGKSTLINSLVGSKVTIVSHKAQTTRNRILGVALKGETQIILMDTPGIFSTPKSRLEKNMVRQAWTSLREADGIMVVVDANRQSFDQATLILERLKDTEKRLILVLNKIDLIPRDNLLALAAQFAPLIKDRIFMVSALTGDGVEDIKAYWEEHLPADTWLFPEDQLSDLPLRLLSAEITREEIFNRLHEELPYAIWVETEAWEEFKNGSVKITQCIYVRKESQKPIVLGKEGHQIKAIGAASRKQLIDILERPVHLFLHVKVKTNWMDDPRLYKSVGLSFKE
jgi:GTP-binding protein Era